eukprot:TRINITY_DN15593_c0_g1_i1.p1 TRINITY_DN15593_c0_g1~~TRINITY_DN15593_c0_g1_i1.p1  ORF type:complete len:175 (+),score=32.42 TRINITY_DN15593_c0_g1_i1:45-569(+)
MIIATTNKVFEHHTPHQKNPFVPFKTCGKPNIQNIMNNVTARPGQSATFKCQVDMSCIVAYIEWYHEMDNGTEKLIKTASSSGDPHVHIIKQVKPTDEGLYTCIAGNVLGQATASAYLEVNAGVFLSPFSASSLLLLLAPLILTLRSLRDASSSPPHHLSSSVSFRKGFQTLDH